MRFKFSFFWRDSLCHWAVATTLACVFFLVRCARGGCKLLETELTRNYFPTCCCDIRKRENERQSKEFVFSLWFAVLGAFALPLVRWKVSAQFTFQFVAVTLGFAFSIFVFLVRLAVPLGGCDNACVIFFLARCARGGCKLLETELTRNYFPTCCCDIRKRENERQSKEFVFSLWFAVLGAFALPLVRWKVSAQFTFQFVAVTLGFAFSIFVFLVRLAVPLGGCDNACVIFFLARCARGGCKLSETELARIYVPPCCCYIGKKFHVFRLRVFLPHATFTSPTHTRVTNAFGPPVV